MADVYDLIVTGGKVFNSSTGEIFPADVAFQDGKVVAIRSPLDPSAARERIDATGGIVAPGLVDVHAHVFDGIGDSVDPDADCLPRGTTTVVDGGSAGANTFRAFARIVGGTSIDILAWLNLSTIGQVDTRVGELLASPHADVDRAIATVEAYPDLIVGLKARLSTYVVGGTTLPVMRWLRECADATSLRVMVHIGDTGEPLGRILDFLKPGDVVTHMMTGRKNGILEADGTLRPEVADARERGVLFDASRGMNHENFLVLERCIDQGFLPDTISTDLTRDTATNPAYGLSLMASHFLSFGMSLSDILACMTSNAANMIRRPNLGTLTADGIGDCTILRRVEEPVRLVDVDGRTRQAEERLRVEAVIKRGQLVTAAPKQE